MESAEQGMYSTRKRSRALGKKTTVLLCGPSLNALGGGPTHLRSILASGLTKRYRFVHFETGSRGPESPSNEETPLGTIVRLAVSPVTLAWRIFRSSARVVHLNSAMDNRAFWRDSLYLVLCKIFRRKVLLQLHGGSLDLVCRGPVRRRLVKALLSMADFLVLLAESERRDYERLGIHTALTVIPNGIDVAWYQGQEERVHSGRIRRMVFLGRIIREKGVFEAVQATERLRQHTHLSDVELHIAGTGPAVEELRAYVCERRLHDCVKLLGPVVGDDKIRFLREADVFVLPSYHQEGLPYAILESLAAGTPVIASNVAGIPDVVRDGVNGILVDPENLEQLVIAIEQMAERPDKLREMSRACCRQAREQLGLDRLARQFERVYEALSF